ncbi:MAG: hypothetical protein ACWA5Q_11695 [bacterium]
MNLIAEHSKSLAVLLCLSSFPGFADHPASGLEDMAGQSIVEQGYEAAQVEFDRVTMAFKTDDYWRERGQWDLLVTLLNQMDLTCEGAEAYAANKAGSGQ